ncbi:MAG: DedA family protein [Acidobacteria bacterium]|nr:DedA family protein [Acidobacteriota bacterium]
MEFFIDLFLNLDEHLAETAAQYGVWIYAILFAIIFAETGLVVTPILPGDSLLFAAGALAALPGGLDIRLVFVLLVTAAILGDGVNYHIGKAVGPRIFSAETSDTWFQRMLNRDHLNKAHAFFEKYGGMAIIMGRFVPIVRTFVPFVAGAGTMTYSYFALCNVAGAIIWVGVCAGGGYIFGNIPVVKENFSLVTIGIIIVSVLPIVIAYRRDRRKTA